MVTEAGRTPDVPMIDRVQQELNIWNIPEAPWRLGKLFGYPIDFNLRTIIFTWVPMAIVLALSLAAAKSAHIRYPGRLAVLYEIIIDFIRDLIKDTMETRKGEGIVSLAMTFLIFITVANMLGIVPTFFAPTADHQTAFALAGVTFVTLHLWGIRYRRGEYLKDFLQPYPFFLPIRLIEEVAKPVTLAIRLFGNMKGKEIMIVALLGLITGVAELAGGFMTSVLWLGFGLFISIIQAFVFTILSIAYISLAVTESH